MAILDDVDEKSPLLSNSINDDDCRTNYRNYCTYLLCAPQSRLHRYIVLFLICSFAFGANYVYDNPASLQGHMVSDLKMSEEAFMALYSWYSWPNAILCIFSGYLIDVLFGVRLAAITLTGFALLGQVIFATGADTDTYWIMCFGRFMLGIGGESLNIAQSIFAIKWFRNNELHMVFGLLSTSSQIGSIINLNTMAIFYKMVTDTFEIFDYRALGLTLFIAALFCLLSFLCACILAILDRRGDIVLRRCRTGSDNVMSIRDIKDFPLSVWYIIIIYVACYAAIFPFIAIGNVFYMMKYDFSIETANFANSIVLILSAVCFPFFGICIDIIGRNLYWMTAGSVCGIGSYMLVTFSFINPFIGLCFLGIGFGVVVSALGPLIAYIVSENKLGTAYGVLMASGNLTVGIISLASGALADAYGFFLVEVFFLILFCMSLVFCLLLFLFDVNHGGILNMKSQERKQFLEVDETVC